MNEPINDGGSAFPTPPGIQHNDGLTTTNMPAPTTIGSEPAFPVANPGNPIQGMTKREYFAGLAMQSMCSRDYKAMILENFGVDVPPELVEEMIGKAAVMQADALLAALNQQPEATLPEHKESKSAKGGAL